ncbi:MAG: class I SAM-dependent methyltransferase [Enterobacteriaceae bacterium]|nr:class I SAM-dependent methyltransferase [Enterobacteriaceae bacterium]
MSRNNYFKSRFVYDPSRDYVWKAIADYLQKYISLNSKVLDLGAGYCNFINNIKARNKVAVDINKEVKKYANSDVKIYICSCSNLKIFKDDSFDVVFASNLFEHLTKPELKKTIKEIKRVLKNKGLLLLIQPNFRYAHKEYFDDYTHQTVFSHTSLPDFLHTHGFVCKKVIPKFIPFSMKSRLKSFSFLIKPYLHLPYKPFAKQMLVVAENIKPVKENK